MRFLAVAAPALSLLLLGAHFYREANWLLVGTCVALLALLAIRKPWARIAVQVALVLGTIEWMRTALLLVNERMAEGRPWTRLAVILGVVALFTAASAAALQRRR